MCFSATASLVVAAGTAGAGVFAVSHVTRWRELPLASIPLVFAAQQAIEGAIWLELDRPGSVHWTAWLASAFAFVALVVWPLFSPIAAGLLERETPRRLTMVALFLVALPVAYFGFLDVTAHPYSVCAVQHTLSYTNNNPYPLLLRGAYIVCTCLPFLLSSHKELRLFAAIVSTGLLISAILYFETVFSVWCFFAAASSVMVCLHFVRVSAAKAQMQPA